MKSFLFVRRFVLLALLAAPLALPAAPEFVTGHVAKTDGADFHQHTTPQVARLGNNQLLALMGVRARSGEPRTSIGGSFSGDGGRTWSAVTLFHQESEKGYAVADPNMLVDGNRLFVYWTRVRIPNEIKQSWVWGMVSEDNGQTWSQPRELNLPRQYSVGKQHNGIKLADGSYAMGISWDRWPERGYNAKTEGETDISTGILRSDDGFDWKIFGDLHVWVEKTTPKAVGGLAEPALVQLGNGDLYMIMRSGASRHYEARSVDGGVTWSEPKPSALVGHNSPSALWRVDRTANDIVVVWNNSPTLRKPLAAALSSDGGATWTKPRNVATSAALGISYPGVTQAADGRFVVVWQAHPVGGGRDIHFAVFNREWLLENSAE